MQPERPPSYPGKCGGSTGMRPLCVKEGQRHSGLSKTKNPHHGKQVKPRKTPETCKQAGQDVDKSGEGPASLENKHAPVKTLKAKKAGNR